MDNISSKLDELYELLEAGGKLGNEDFVIIKKQIASLEKEMAQAAEISNEKVDMYSDYIDKKRFEHNHFLSKRMDKNTNKAGWMKKDRRSKRHMLNMSELAVE